MKTTLIIVPITLLLAAQAIVTCEARKRRNKSTLKYRDCGTDPDRPLQFQHVDAHPVPIVIPGTLYVSLKGNMTRSLPPKINLEVSVMKYIFGFPFIIPCINGRVGSCTYENLCGFLERYEVFGCPRVLAKQKIPCYCPFKPGLYNVRHLAINLPKVTGFASMLIYTTPDACSTNSANLKKAHGCFTCDDPKVSKACSKLKGDYEFTARVMAEGGKELGCLELKFSLKRRHRGWFFKI